MVGLVHWWVLFGECAVCAETMIGIVRRNMFLSNSAVRAANYGRKRCVTVFFTLADCGEDATIIFNVATFLSYHVCLLWPCEECVEVYGWLFNYFQWCDAYSKVKKCVYCLKVFMWCWRQEKRNGLPRLGTLIVWEIIVSFRSLGEFLVTYKLYCVFSVSCTLGRGKL